MRINVSKYGWLLYNYSIAKMNIIYDTIKIEIVNDFYKYNNNLIEAYTIENRAINIIYTTPSDEECCSFTLRVDSTRSSFNLDFPDYFYLIDYPDGVSLYDYTGHKSIIVKTHTEELKQ